MTYEVVNAFPHDPDSFTQGLIFLDGVLYESTGLYGESSLRRVALETGEVQRLVFLPDEVFGEGLTDWEETLVQLTWREGIGYVYNRDDFSHLTQFNYETEGWGLTQDGENLIMSDGSATLFFLDPETYAILSTVDVLDEDAPVTMLNELEYIQGEIFANIWQTDTIVRIDPETGAVKGWIDLGGLLPEEERTYTTNVLNGIAYDPETDRLFVTGKRWPKLYEIRLVPIGADH
jgi:glutamine cyclotransferase